MTPTPKQRHAMRTYAAWHGVTQLTTTSVDALITLITSLEGGTHHEPQPRTKNSHN